jgi:hypothetical protein
MEINYDIIIKHLCGKHTKTDNKENKKEINAFQTQKNIYTYATTFPDVFKELFSDKFYRYGITTHDNEHNNISFWSSVLSVLDKSFLIPYTSDEISMVNQFKTQLTGLFDKTKLSDFIKKLDKNDMRERFKLNPDVTVIQYIADTLEINFWIFDFKSGKINVVYPKDIMNPWKQSVFLANYDISWEPIMFLKSKGTVTRLFDYNHSIFKKLLCLDNVKYLDGESIGKEYIYIDNLSDVIKQEKQQLKIEVKELLIDSETDSSVHTEDSEDESKKYFVKPDELDEFKQLNKTKMTKMKVAELVDITKKLNIVITKKNPTKAILMDSILNKISTV